VQQSPIRATDSLHTVTLAGTILTDFLGVQLGNNAVDDYNSTLTVTQSGQIISQYEGVYLFNAGSTVTNAGLIQAEGNAINIHSNTGSAIVVNNSGRIEGGNGIVSSGLYGLPGLTVHNTGEIYAVNGTAIYSTGLTQVTNHGDVFGAVTTGFHNDILINRGLFAGDVSLGQGGDTFDNRNGAVEGDVLLGDGDDIFDTRGGMVTGTIFGGDGGDVILSNTEFAEIIDGGDGLTDVLEMRFGAGVVLALDNSFESAGGALGDVVTGFEFVYGSVAEADIIRGNDLTNTLLGFGGADMLDGAGGADAIRGGTGQDTLTGGDGNDVFRYFTRAELGDVITDFSSTGVGNNDNFQFRGVGIGGGLALGALNAAFFQTRADNLAQDADDRFIFRTTDHTLWFDADGNGAGAAMLVADLQAGATVAAHDIIIV
jgi:Ca2+-binding RTX toxin-like protein